MSSSKASIYHDLIDRMKQSFQRLNSKINSETIESLSSIIYQAMTARYRVYHRINHVFDISEKAKPLEVLAMIFHDLVYLQVDKRIHPVLEKYLMDFPLNRDFSLVLPALGSASLGPEIEMVYDVFGFQSGQKLTPFSGANEFLSTIVATRALKDILRPWEVVEVMSCIEGTIPFRPSGGDGALVASNLLDRLKKLNEKFRFRVPLVDIKETVKASVRCSNVDIANFASIDSGLFLSQTWNLILEENAVFLNPLYKVKQYREALMKVSKFQKTLSSDRIFRRYEDVPAMEQFEQLKKRADTNIALLLEYLKIQIVAVGLIEALSELTGGDAPYVLFVGELPFGERQRQSALETYLNMEIPVIINENKNIIIQNLLRFGRANPTSFDFNNAPLAAYLYERLTNSEIISTGLETEKFFSGKLDALSLLKSFPHHILEAILDAVSQVAEIRKEKIQALKKKIVPARG